MKRALLVFHSEQSASALAAFFREEGCSGISTVYSAYSARQRLESGDEYDLVCINAPLSDEKGIQLAIDIASSSKANVIVIVPKESYEEAGDILSRHGVLVFSKPLNRRLFQNLLRYSDSYRERLLSFESETERLRSMVEDIRIIDRAKLLLVTCLGMSESSAHRYLEKQAMDLRLSKLEVAKQVIRTYEN